MRAVMLIRRGIYGGLPCPPRHIQAGKRPAELAILSQIPLPIRSRLMGGQTGSLNRIAEEIEEAAVMLQNAGGVSEGDQLFPKSGPTLPAVTVWRGPHRLKYVPRNIFWRRAANGELICDVTDLLRDVGYHIFVPDLDGRVVVPPLIAHT